MSGWLIVLLVVVSWACGVVCGGLPFVVGRMASDRDRQRPTDREP